MKNKAVYSALYRVIPSSRYASQVAFANDSTRSKVLIVGPIPPPYIGPAVATDRLLRSKLLLNAFTVEHLDTSDPGGEHDIGMFTGRNVLQGIRQVWNCWRVLLSFRPDIVYISIARGLWGFLRDVCLILPSRLFGAHVIIHLRAGRFDLIHDCKFVGRLVARVGLAPVKRALVLGRTVRNVFGGYVPEDRIRVVPNGIDLSAWPKPECEPASSSGSPAQ